MTKNNNSLMDNLSTWKVLGDQVARGRVPNVHNERMLMNYNEQMYDLWTLPHLFTNPTAMISLNISALLKRLDLSA